MISMLIAALFKSIREFLVFYSFFVPLRSIGGGWHAKKTYRCLLVSFAVTIMLCLNVDFALNVYNINLIISIYCLCIIAQTKIIKFIYFKKVTNKIIVNIINIIGTLLAIYFCRYNLITYTASITFAQLTWSISIIASRYEKSN